MAACARIARRIIKLPSGCYHWCGAHDTGGFPHFSLTCNRKRTNYKLHRVLFAAANPTLDLDGWCVIQTCMDKGCLNVEHMERMIKTDADKLRDPLTRRSKRVSLEIARRIRRMPTGANMAAVARDLGIAPSTARLIRCNRAWKE